MFNIGKKICPICDKELLPIIGHKGLMHTCYNCRVAFKPNDPLLDLVSPMDCPICHKEMRKMVDGSKNVIKNHCPKCQLTIDAEQDFVKDEPKNPNDPKPPLSGGVEV